MYHYIYKITVEEEKYCNHYYYGKHSTDKLDDGYIGSGLKIKRLKNKGYTLKKEILCFFDTSELAFEFEELLIDEDVLSDPFCLNLKTGGSTGYTYTIEAKNKMSEAAKNRESNFNEVTREKAKTKQSSTRKALWETNEYREKMKNRSTRKSGTLKSKNLYVTPAGTFDNRSIAAEANGITDRILYARCRQNYTGYSLIKKGGGPCR